MRNFLSLGLLSCALLPLACSAGGKKGSSLPDNVGGGSNGNGSGGAPIINVGGGGPPMFNLPEVGGGAPMDPDPGNPNIAHALCGGGMCADFPEQPIMGTDGSIPSNVATLFGAPDNFAGGSLCVLEPQLSTGDKPGAMLPANWTRPRFRVMAPAGIDILEIRLKSPAEAHELVAYTTYKPNADGSAPSWYLPAEVWSGKKTDKSPPSGTGLANNAGGQPVTVTIRGINSKSPGMPVGIKGDFNVAPVVATGSMVFWTVNSASVTPQSSKLLGFAVGDEGVANALALTDVKWAGEIGEDGSVLRGYYDTTPLPGFVNGQVRCVGCHSTIPDGSGVVFNDDWPWSKAAASLTMGSVGAIPATIGAGAQAIMKTPWWGQQTMSAAHWSAGDRTMVTSYGATFQSGMSRTKGWQGLPTYKPDDKIKYHQLAWIDMESTTPIDVAVTSTPMYGMPVDTRNAAVLAAKGTAWGLIATGDAMVSDVSPSFSHDGKKIVYVTTDYSPDGHPDATAKTADIRTVDYNNRAGGTSAPLMGASDPAFLEYYPSYSQDDQLIAFTRAPAPSATSPDGPYYNRFGQIMVVPAAGGTPVAIAANDPGTCAGDSMTTGIINSWPKWSPDVVKFGGKTYYFLVFSSGRKYGDEFSKQFPLPVNSSITPLPTPVLPQSSQLYLAAVVVDDMTKQITSYPAVYIWNQNRTPGADGKGASSLQYSNLTPAWDPISLPPLVIPPPEGMIK